MTLTTINSYASNSELFSPALFPKQCKSSRINEICKALNHFGILSGPELYAHFPKVMSRISQSPSVFKNYDAALCYTIFQQAVNTYERVKETSIALGRRDCEYFSALLRKIRRQPLAPLSKKLADSHVQDLERIGKNYDRFETSVQTLRETSRRLENLFQAVEYAVVPHVILGLGDAGTTLWLEKYAQYHQIVKQQINQRIFPKVIILGQSLGSMKNSYALAQTHNVLERGKAASNPKDFISTASYEDNQFVDGRHLYQSNIVNLGKTGAPALLKTTVTKIERRENKPDEWHYADQGYRLKVQIAGGKEKHIYTNELDVCTGLGYAKKKLIQELAGTVDFEKLSQINEEKGYPPLIDGDQYIFNYHEGNSKQDKRTIVIFGGGDTSAAAYRKAYFGRDFCLKEYSEKDQKNDVLWISNHGFARVGTGTMPTKALDNARVTAALFEAHLKRIAFDSFTKKLQIYVAFKQSDNQNSTSIVQNINEGAEEWVKIECDQLIYSIGQDSEERGQLFHQLKNDVVLDHSPDHSLMGMKTTDDNVHFLGAAAQTMGGKAYADAMFDWIARNNISDDSAAPAVLPPSRALIKLHAVKHGAALQSVNANTDDLSLVKQYLTSAGVELKKREAFISDLIINRRRTESGMSRLILQSLLDKHGLSTLLTIKGHCMLENQ